MRVSAERLAAAAEATGFRADMLERVAQLIGLLAAIQRHPFLRGKLALKGGTALNLFVFDVPRLSVDIDLNYLGAESREAMLAERPRLEEALDAVFRREDLSSRQTTNEHAGSSWTLRYPTASGQTGRVDVDINYMYRVPLWPITVMASRRVGDWQATGVPVVDVHELAAGKLAALLSRQRARDLFDSRLIFSIDALDLGRLRTAFVVYGAMNRRDWRTVSTGDVSFDAAELANQLAPALRGGAEQSIEVGGYGQTLVDECRHALSALLPFTEGERAFLDRLLDGGEIDATLLTDDPGLQQRIEAQPLLAWKAQHVRSHRTAAGAVSGRQAGSGSARNRTRAAAHWPAQGQRFARCRVQRRAEWVSRPARAK